VIDRPESVSRVRPPTAIMTTTSTKSACSQSRIARRPQAWRARAPPVTPPGVAAGFCVSLTSSKMLRFSAMAPFKRLRRRASLRVSRP
jgi:hypothetical protein